MFVLRRRWPAAVSNWMHPATPMGGDYRGVPRKIRAPTNTPSASSASSSPQRSSSGRPWRLHGHGTPASHTSSTAMMLAMSNAHLNDDAFAEKTVLETFKKLDEWQHRSSKAYIPAPGSDLAVDDQDVPGFSLSMLATSGLAAASDHLSAIRRHVESKPGALFPFAHMTLCRSALVGAAQCVWLLGPDDPDTRVARSRTVAVEVHKRHLQWVSGLQGLATTPHIGTDAVADHVAKRLAELEAKRAADGQKAVLDTTRMIREAAEAAFDQPDLVEEAVLVWRSTSGAAHGFPWPLFGTSGTTMTKLAGPDGIAEFQAGGSLARMANPFMAAYHLGDRGWELLDQRGAAPD